MKLYMIRYDDDNVERCTWAGTKVEAKRAQKALEQVHGKYNVDMVVGVDVPTDKSGLLDFLNSRATLVESKDD